MYFHFCFRYLGHPQARCAEVPAPMFSLRLCDQGPPEPDQTPEAACDNDKSKQQQRHV